MTGLGKEATWPSYRGPSMLEMDTKLRCFKVLQLLQIEHSNHLFTQWRGKLAEAVLQA